MTAEYCFAESENGERHDDPSEEMLYLLIDGLHHKGNGTFVVAPADGETAWYAVVSVLENGAFEIERRDIGRREHDLDI